MGENSNGNDMAGVGQGQAHSEPIEKYDAEHGKYSRTVPTEPNLPQPSPAAADPSPFRVGSTK